MNNNELKIVVSAKDQASAVIDKVQGSIDNATGKMSASLERVKAAANVAAAGIAAAGASMLGATAVGFRFNSAVEQAEAQMMAFTKDAGKTAETLAWVKDEASKTQFSFTEMAEATAGLIPASKQSGIEIKKLVQQAEVLAALNPAEGLTGAAFALREALSGDFVSVVERFNLPRQRLNELKAQGVPAMEAISKALAEMGIDYSIVEAQGQTTAARFDQIKDKLVMMAGAASKPIFDRVSKGLDDLANGFDFEAWGARATNAVVSLMEKARLLAVGIRALGGAFQEGDITSAGFVGKMELIGSTAKQVWETLQRFLGPSLKMLSGTLRTQLAPALDKITPYLDDIAKIIGGVLVAAVWLIINVLTALVTVLATIINAFFKVKDAIGSTVNAIAVAFRALGAAWAETAGAIADTAQEVQGAIVRAWQEAFSAVRQVMQAIWTTAVKPVLDVITTAVRAMASVYIYIFSVIRGAALLTWWSIYNEAVVPVRDAIITAWNAVKDAAYATWQWIYSHAVLPVIEAITAVMQWYFGVVSSIWSAISSTAAVAWQGVSSFAVGAWQSIYGVWSGIANWFASIWRSITVAGESASGAVGNAFGSVAETIKNAFKSSINWVIDRLNSLVDGLNSTVGRLPGVGKIEKLPKFASGGSAPGGQPIVVGERRAEVYVPNTRGRIEPTTANYSGGTGEVNNYLTGTFNFANAEASNAFFDRIDKTARLSQMGVA